MPQQLFVGLANFQTAIQGHASAVILFGPGQPTAQLLEELHTAYHFVGSELTDSTKFNLKYAVLTEEETQDASLKNIKLPLLRFYDGVNRIADYDGRLYARQMSYFLKRQLQFGKKRISAIVTNLEHFEKLGQESEPVVIFCGPETSTHFDLFEGVAKGKKYLYYHIFDRAFCTRINTRRTGAEKNIWLKKGDYTLVKLEERYKVLPGKSLDPEQILAVKQEVLNATNQIRKKQNQTELTLDKVTHNELNVPEDDQAVNEQIWSEHLIQEPVVFVLYSKNSVFEQVKVTQDADRLRRELEYASISNFYTNFDTLYDFLYDDKYESKIYASFSPTNQTEESFPCSTIASMSKQMRLADKSLKFGCFSREELPKFGLEIHNYNTDSHTVFFFSYYDIFTKQEGKISRPFRYKLENPQTPEQVENFLKEVKAGKVSRYLFGEHIPENKTGGTKDDPVKLLTRTTLKPWVEQQLEAGKAVIVFTVYSRSSATKRDALEGFRTLLANKNYADVVALADIDTGNNEIDDIIEDDDTPKLFLWKRGSKFESPVKILNPNEFDSTRVNVAKHIPELGEVEAEAETAKTEHVDL